MHSDDTGRTFYRLSVNGAQLTLILGDSRNTGYFDTNVQSLYH